MANLLGDLKRRALIAFIFGIASIAFAACSQAKAEDAANSKLDRSEVSQPTMLLRDFLRSLQQALRDRDERRVISLMRFPVRVGEGPGAVDMDEKTFNLKYGEVWSSQALGAAMNEDADRIEWPPGAPAVPLGCGEVWVEMTREQQFRISGIDISEYRIAGMSIQDCYGVRAFVNRLKTAVATGKRDQVILMLKYPLRYHGLHRTMTLHNAREALRQYDRIFSPRLRHAIEKQDTRDLGGNAEGIAIGYGFIWINRSSKKGNFEITSIFEPAIPI